MRMMDQKEELSKCKGEYVWSVGRRESSVYDVGSGRPFCSMILSDIGAEVSRRLFSAMPIIVIVPILAWAGIPSMSWAQESATAGVPAQAMKEIPKDFDPNSGSPLPLMKRENLDEYGKKVFDKIFNPGHKQLVGARGTKRHKDL